MVKQPDYMPTGEIVEKDLGVVQNLLDTVDGALASTRDLPPDMLADLQELTRTVSTAGDGQIAEAHSISAGLDYPGVGPEHSHWHDTGRATYVSRTDDEALAGLQRLARLEGILCALETAHAIAALDEVTRLVGAGGLVVVNLSGRGDKDMITVAKKLGVEL